MSIDRVIDEEYEKKSALYTRKTGGFPKRGGCVFAFATS